MPPQITTNSAAWHLTSFVGDSGQEFTSQQWYDFCEARLQLIRPYLGEQTLSTLAKVECKRVEYHWAELGARVMRRLPDEADYRGADWSELIQGIFGVGDTELYTEHRHSDGHIWVYGVERRSANWTLCKVVFNGAEGWKGRGIQHPHHFVLTEVGIEELCDTSGVHPRQVFLMLGIEVQRWYAAATKRYSDMTNLAHLVSAEDLILKARMTCLDQEESEEEGED